MTPNVVASSRTPKPGPPARSGGRDAARPGAGGVSPSPYRSLESGGAPGRREVGADGERWVALAFWVVSVVRVGLAFGHDERFGAEATLALLAVMGIPWLLLRREWVKRRAIPLTNRRNRWPGLE